MDHVIAFRTVPRVLVWSVLLLGPSSSAQSDQARSLADKAYWLVDTDVPAARSMALEAIRMARVENDSLALHDGLNALRYAHFVRGEYSACLERSLEALRVSRALGSERAIGDDHGWVASVMMEVGRAEEGYAHARKSMDHMIRSNDSTAIANGWCDMSNAALVAGRPAEALNAAHEAVRIYEALNDPAGASFALGLLGGVHLKSKRWMDAWPFLNKAYRYAETHGEEIEKAWLERDLAMAAANMGRLQEAERYADLAAVRIHRVNAIKELPDLHAVLMAIRERQGDLRGALNEARMMIALKDSLNTADLTARLALALGSADQVVSQLNETAATAENIEVNSDLQDLRQQHWWLRAGSISVAALLILAVFLLIRSYRTNRTVSTQLQEALDHVDELRGHRMPKGAAR